jgi:hypothetical protein
MPGKRNLIGGSFVVQEVDAHTFASAHTDGALGEHGSGTAQNAA